MKFLVTGDAGINGSHVARRLLERGDEVIGFTNLNDCYDVNLKKARLARFMAHPAYTHVAAYVGCTFLAPVKDAVENVVRWNRSKFAGR